MSIVYLGSGFRLVGLLGVICGDTFSFKLLGLGIIFLIRSEEIDVIIAGLLFLLLSGSRGSLASEDDTGAAGTREGGELGLVGLDVLVPAGDVGVSQILRKGLEDGNISLRWGVTDKEKKGSSQFLSLRRTVDMKAIVERVRWIGKSLSACLKQRCLVA